MIDYNPRDLEWQRRYEENDTPWDKGAPAPPLVRYLKEHRIVGRVLVPGCGMGHEVRALAAQAGATVVGLDVSPTAVAEAAKIAAPSLAGGSASFVAGDFFEMPPELRGSFDWVVEHTCFCAIDPRRRPDYVLAVAAALRSGGKIFAIFYLNPDTETGPPFAVTQEELDRLFAPHFVLLEEGVPEVSFPGRENRELIRVLQKRDPDAR
jgi:SAM-dependent methyltransferase